MYCTGFLPKKAHITGYARSELSREEYVKRITAHLKVESDSDKQKLDGFLKITDYTQGQYDQDESWKDLDKHLKELEQERGLEKGQKNRLFYMALPPSVFLPVATGLSKFVYSSEGHNRIVVEKPFGKDLESSTHLAKDLGELFKEDEVNITNTHTHIYIYIYIYMYQFFSFFFLGCICKLK